MGFVEDPRSGGVMNAPVARRMCGLSPAPVDNRQPRLCGLVCRSPAMANQRSGRAVGLEKPILRLFSFSCGDDQ